MIIGAQTLPWDPASCRFQVMKDNKEVPLYKQLPLQLDFGPKGPVLQMKGTIASPTLTPSQLEDIVLYFDSIFEKRSAFPRVFTDDNQTSYWTRMYNAGTGIAAFTPTEDSTYMVKGKNCWYAVISSGTDYASWYISHLCLTGKEYNLLYADFISQWIYTSAVKTWRIQFTDKGVVDHSNKYYKDFITPVSTWTRLFARKDEFTLVGSVDWSKINFIWCEIVSGGFTGTIRLDRFCAGIGVLIQGPLLTRRYNGVYQPKQWTFDEDYKTRGAFPFEMQFIKTDDYY